MLFRVFVSLGLLALGYYVGREMGRAEPIRSDLKNLRDEEHSKAIPSKTQTINPPGDRPGN